jgi:hypothetical protein
MTDLVAPADPRALIDIAVRPEADAFPMFEGDAFLGPGHRYSRQRATGPDRA